MSEQAPRISLIIPCRDEANRLPSTLRALDSYLTEAGLSGEILVVDDGSSDGTAEIAEKFSSARVIRLGNGRGKGYAVGRGVREAEGDFIFFMDADLSVPPRCIGEFVEEFARVPTAILIGDRRHPGSVLPRRQPFPRELAGRIFNIGLRLCGATGFRDTQCGFKAFTRESARDIFPRLQVEGFGFDVEALAVAEVLGWSVRSMPVEWSDSPGSKVRPLAHGASSFFAALRAVRRARRLARNGRMIRTI